MKPWWLPAGALLLLCACASTPCAWIAPGERMCAAPLPPQPPFARRDEKVQASTPRGALLGIGSSEWQPALFSTVVTTPFGQPLYSLQYDGRRLRFEPGLLPVPIPAENVLIDWQLSWWPLAALRPRLPAHAELSERSEGATRWRELRIGGELRVRIRYQGAADAPDVLYEQLGLGYSLRLTPLPPPPP